jgi:hypothetical protein
MASSGIPLWEILMPAASDHVPNTQSERDSHAMRRLQETVPKGWVINARGPIHYRYGAVDWEVEACDSSHSHCDRGYGTSLADAADRCREALDTAAGR